MGLLGTTGFVKSLASQMQSLIGRLDGILGGNTAAAIGGLLLGLLAIRLVIWIIDAAVRAWQGARWQQLDLQRLRAQIALIDSQRLRAETEQKTQGWNGFRKFKVA